MQEPDTTYRSSYCPLVKTPYQDCYCVSLHSQAIERVATFCGGDYEKCPIYLRNEPISSLMHKFLNRTTGSV